MLNTQQMDPALYREAMSRYAGHVQIVTTEFAGVRRGVTITAACSVSDNPPSLLVCLNNTNDKNAVFFESTHFAVNTLGLRHQELANAFAGFGGLSADERFALGTWEKRVTGAPMLADAIVSLDCRVTERVVTATHTVLFGEIVAILFGPADQALMYLDRGYRAL